MKKWLNITLISLVVIGMATLAVVECQEGRGGVKAVASKTGKTIKSLHEESLLWVDEAYTDTNYVEDLTCHADGREDVSVVRYADGSDFTIRYVYKDGRLERKDCAFAGQPSASVIYQYDKEGRLASVSDSEHPMPLETYLYDEEGRKEWTYMHNGETDSILYSYHTRYDEQNRVTEEVQYGMEYENQVYEVHTFAYDERGNLKEEKIENADGMRIVSYEYKEFDEQGSWTLCYKTEKQMSSDKVKKTRTTRKLTYY